MSLFMNFEFRGVEEYVPLLRLHHFNATRSVMGNVMAEGIALLETISHNVNVTTATTIYILHS